MTTWIYKTEHIHEKLYLTPNSNWIVEMVDEYGEGHSRYLGVDEQRAYAWLSALDEKDRQDFDLSEEEL